MPIVTSDGVVGLVHVHTLEMIESTRNIDCTSHGPITDIAATEVKEIEIERKHCD
jgi:hypothetical protein